MRSGLGIPDAERGHRNPEVRSQLRHPSCEPQIENRNRDPHSQPDFGTRDRTLELGTQTSEPAFVTRIQKPKLEVGPHNPNLEFVDCGTRIRNSEHRHRRTDGGTKFGSKSTIRTRDDCVAEPGFAIRITTRTPRHVGVPVRNPPAVHTCGTRNPVLKFGTLRSGPVFGTWIRNPNAAATFGLRNPHLEFGPRIRDSNSELGFGS